ncbi:hypothetical protein V7O66_08840 [Methanolobus sp. ZRKC3]|uniref:hypothetical protein n=1 Tax=Methanolobus sp. ZRKC3 TaxID=3125786 RepID=UPI003249E131
MRYINFVILCICLFTFFLLPASAVEISTMIHHSEQEVKLDETVYLEQGYFFEVRDINSNSGDLWLEVYHDGKKLDSDSFARVESPLKYIKTVENSEDEEKEYLVIRITSLGDVDGSGRDMTSRIKIEQFDDGSIEEDAYLFFDSSLTLEVGASRSLGGGYALEVSYMEDDEFVVLKLLKGNKVLKEEELEEGEYFYYTVDVDGRPETQFLAKLDSFFISSDMEMVFLDQVSLKKDVSLDSDGMDGITAENGTSLVIVSSNGDMLLEGDVAIIRYIISESFSSIKVLADGEIIDSRSNVNAGIYSTASGKLSTGVHEFSLLGISDGVEKTLVSEKITIEASMVDSLSSSAKGFVESAGNALDTNKDSGSTIPGISDSTVIILLLCAVLFLLLAPRKK